jgi:hypothetical protein
MKDCTEEARDLIERKSSIIVQLDDVIEYCDSEIQCTTQWQQCLSVFTQKVNPTGRGNFANKPGKKGKKVDTNIQKLKDILITHINSQYDRIESQKVHGYKLSDAPILEKQELGRMAGIKPHDVTRAFKKEPYLEKLRVISHSNEEIQKYGKRL